MDINSVAGSSSLVAAAQTQQAMSITIMKQAADQQNQMANLLAQNVDATRPNPDYNFSIYA